MLAVVVVRRDRETSVFDNRCVCMCVFMVIIFVIIVSSVSLKGIGETNMIERHEMGGHGHGCVCMLCPSFVIVVNYCYCIRLSVGMYAA